ncbi:MAG: hypothetical protein QOE24_1746, partial [Frankiales bacterium]|nr:hypothetical protein [Frankiales bacterium]
ALHEWCLPATLDPAAGRPTAILATPEGLHLAPAGVRVALWAQAEDLTTEAFRTATVILSDDPTVVAAAGARGLRAPTGRHLGSRRPMSPFVRERLRHGRGLPPDALLERLPTGWVFGPPAALKPIEADLVETALGAAAAVIVTEPGWLIRALAWGAPSVTNAATAAAVGALAPDEVLVAETAKGRRAAAVALTAGPVEASRLSWRGYRRVEGLDAERAALALVDRLGLWPETPPRPAPPLPTVELALRLLGTPTDAHVRSRLADAADRLTAAT